MAHKFQWCGCELLRVVGVEGNGKLPVRIVKGFATFVIFPTCQSIYKAISHCQLVNKKINEVALGARQVTEIGRSYSSCLLSL